MHFSDVIDNVNYVKSVIDRLCRQRQIPPRTLAIKNSRMVHTKPSSNNPPPPSTQPSPLIHTNPTPPPTQPPPPTQKEPTPIPSQPLSMTLKKPTPPLTQPPPPTQKNQHQYLHNLHQ